MNRKKALDMAHRLGLTNLSDEQMAAAMEVMKRDTIPRGHYRVKRLSAWLSKKGFDYVINQKFRILEGDYAGREVLIVQELDDSDALELKEDAEV